MAHTINAFWVLSTGLMSWRAAIRRHTTPVCQKGTFPAKVCCVEGQHDRTGNAVDRCCSKCYVDHSRSPEWRNGIRRRLKIGRYLVPWGFKYPLRHYRKALN